MNYNRKHQGTITIELITAIALLIVITAALMASLEFYAHCNRLQWTRQRCLSAAQAQLDSIMVQKAPLSQEDIYRLWPGVQCTLSKQSGSDPWKGLDLYTVTATSKVRKRIVSIQLKRYIKSGE
jgi:type II secretory pathway pseudopilin PulG